MRNYGLGALWGKPVGSNQTPKRFAVVKDVSLDIGGELDMLRGEKFFAVAAGKKGGKAAGKIGIAEFNPDLLPYVVPGVASATGTHRIIDEEVGVVPGTPYQVAVAQAATFVEDLGVKDTTTGLYLTVVASGPTTGQYAVSAAGVYTFAAADTTHSMRISYRYSVAGSGKTYTFNNQIMAESTAIGLNLFATGMRLYLPSIHIPKIGYGLKSENWSEFSLEYEATADASGVIAYKYVD